MTSIMISVKVKDEDYHKFISKKGVIQAKINQLVREELEEA